MREFMIALRVTIFTLIVCGVVYPFVTTGFAQVLFPGRANGSLVSDDKGRVVGSELIAQGFSTAGVLPAPALGRRQWLRRHGVFGFQLLAHVAEASRSHGR